MWLSRDGANLRVDSVIAGGPAAEGGGRLIRPLLSVTRAQTAAYCEARGLRWCDDESNESRLFARARVRHGLVGALRAVHPAAEANVLRTAELMPSAPTTSSASS